LAIGHAVAVYGTTDKGHGVYNVTLDGFTTQYNGSSDQRVGETLLFYQSGLTNSEAHLLQLVNAGDGSTFTLSHIDVWFSSSSLGTGQLVCYKLYRPDANKVNIGGQKLSRDPYVEQPLCLL
jgi:hypothetical protein